MKKPSKANLRRKCDDLFSKSVRAFGHCERCLKTSNLQCAHIYSRANLHLRYDNENTLCLCAGCHFWAHAEPAAFVAWINYQYPFRLDSLAKKRNVLETSFDWPKKYEELKNA